MRAIIVDDEPPARRRLARLLAALPGVVLSGEAGSAAELLALLPAAQADVVFLDIRMPGLDGLALARSGALPPVVFTTAFSEHAVDAFDVRAVDYLVKPIRAERLVAAVDRVREALAARGGVAALAEALSKLGPPAQGPPRVTAISRGDTRIFDARTVTRFRAADKYTVFLVDGCELETEESLTSLEARLAPHGFVRAHRAELIHTGAVRALRRDAGGLTLELTDGQEVSVSRRYAAAVRARLGV